jgi:hypothetical protein
VSTYFLATPLGTTHIDPSNRPSMAGSRDSSEVSPSNIIEPAWKTLPADEQLQFEEHKEQLIQEARAKFLANFKVDRNNKVVRQRATNPASLRPTPDIPNVSNTNELQSLKNYVDEHREQMQNIIGDMQNDYRRLVCAFDKSSIANFPSHEVELGGNTRNTSTIGCHDQSQPLYGMPMDTYPEQPQIGSKSADLHISGPSPRERGPSGPATTGPIFNELPRHAPEPPHMAQNLNYPVGPSTYNDGRSAYNHGWSTYNHGRSGYISGQSAHESFEEDCYLNPHPSQQHFHHTMQCISPLIQNPELRKAFRPRLEGRKGTINPMSHIGQTTMHRIAQTSGGGGRQHTNIQPTPPMFD